MNAKLVLLGLLGILALWSLPSEALAGHGPHGGYWGPGYGYGYYWTGYRHFTRPDIPYYAINPPVYYSHPVKRPYGFSPYAWLPAYERPIAPPAAGGAGSHGRSRPAPLKIVNPYVAKPGDPGVSPDAVMPRATAVARPE